MRRSDLPKTTASRVRTGPKPKKTGITYMRNGGRASPKSKGSKICPAGKAWAKRTFDTYPSAYANMAASKYCKDPNYAKGSKKKKKRA
jgi:mannose/cellobiose epimerase-like protein (N-acyl-D-glucosamine 2-epimerase family)|tara:strand:- start:732 stop:995 length:264 start_codon:yes stop_codon:yes gene_type:complete